MKSLAGARVIVTGASRGIGLATVEAFLGEGARLALCARDPRRLGAVAERLSQVGEVFAQAFDIRDGARVERFVNDCAARWGGIDVLVNNAGVLWTGPFVEQDYASLEAVIDSNVKGVMYAARAVLPHMLSQGGGVIVNIASGAGLTGFADLAAYSASKFAVVGFTESLDSEVGGAGVRVYALCPGRVATDMQREYSGAKLGMPPGQVAARIVRLAAGGSGDATGRCLPL